MVDAYQTLVIVGGGLAGAKAAETLRAEGFNGRVILIGDERDHPYERPPLSKGYLLGKKDRDSALVHEPAWYAAHDVELHLGQTVTAVDRDAHTVRLGDGTVIRYDKLLLATGSEPRRLDIPGTGLAGVHHLRRLSHSERLRDELKALGRDNGHLVIAGAGWIGLEVAAAARTYGAEVTVVEADPTPLHRVLGPELGQLFADLHTEHGVRFHFGARITEITGQDVSYDRVPYFFTDQYDLGMEYSGWAPPGSYDQVVVRGDTGKREFIAFWLHEGRVIAGMNVNVWDVTEPIQKLIRSRAAVDPDALCDPSVPLGSLL
ncbi:NAD(P)/FAD-dependent oxidoreductase [Streptomyces sp. NPDC058757]|uniref:NAD(P)/FAD-dependent oxidoreductase n=1 Tax=Streptomyces sp. NPDC058757 TaxID=3346626 RepID=UPI0036749AC5